MAKSDSTKVALKITSAVLRVFLNILFYIAIILVLIQAVKITYNFSYQLFGSVSVEAEPGIDIEFQIAKGESTMDVARKLEAGNLIVNKYSFYLKTKFKDYNIYPGTFILNTSMDYDEILDVITDYNNSIVKEEDEGKKQDTKTSPNSNVIP
ncbi:endolytic transglycosylase MltG [Lachnoclostridium phytofermentans]|uniref:Uncharacterized protein n=1 Tax=Lachnoclostridium phytofermentans (strain ATCC 700394 / DSM 18823 / ISDg) TaxID=357809 RepID=A9KKS2_LACP7|nr:endolytic transglycosylase MltG [Lachnoclostridium phytofermentans]ABX42654.1 hypothetical protein Cphy_2293 [Lachnoclostridium phytofermentans ISDg]